MPDSVQVESIDERTLAVTLAGDWIVRHGMPSPEALIARVAGPAAPTHVAIHATALERWASSPVSYVAVLEACCRSRTIAFDKADLPPGIRRRHRVRPHHHQRCHGRPAPWRNEGRRMKEGRKGSSRWRHKRIQK